MDGFVVVFGSGGFIFLLRGLEVYVSVRFFVIFFDFRFKEAFFVSYVVLFWVFFW